MKINHEKVAERFFYASCGFAIGSIGCSFFAVREQKKLRKDYHDSLEKIMKNAGDRVGTVRNVFQELAELNGKVMREDYEQAVKEKFEFLELLMDQPFLDLEAFE